MSVPVPKRNVESSPNYDRFYAVDQARKFAAHTVTICSNPKFFNPKYKAVIDEIIDYATVCYLRAYAANRIKVTGYGKYENRRYMQQSAIQAIENIIPFIEFAKELFKIKNRKYNYWMEQALKTRNYLNKWLKDEEEKLGRPLKEKRDMYFYRKPAGP